MKTLLVGLTLVVASLAQAGNVTFSNQVTLPSSASQVKLVDAEYVLVPTQTAIHTIPNCNPHGEQGLSCEETVVLASAAAIRANIGYRDSFNMGEGNEMSYTSVMLNPASFSADEVNLLKSVYPQWKHPFSNAGRDFARNHLNMVVSKVKTSIQIIDVKKSHFCHESESGMIAPNCVEHLVYKTVSSSALVATVNRK